MMNKPNQDSPDYFKGYDDAVRDVMKNPIYQLQQDDHWLDVDKEAYDKDTVLSKRIIVSLGS